MLIGDTAGRLASAVREARVLSGVLRRLDPVREVYWRPRSIERTRPTAAALVDLAMEAALGAEPDRPSSRVRQIEGMSGQRYRTFINRLIGLMGSQARYLEIGAWKGSTLCAAIENNNGQAVCIDNWSQFGGPKHEFLSNVSAVRTKVSLRVIEGDFRGVEFDTLGLFNVFLFDGPHEEHDQYDGLKLAQPALASPHVLIVDDWNWRRVRIGTFRAIHDCGWRIAHSHEIRTTQDDSHAVTGGSASDWHNGYFIGLLEKGD